MSASQVSLHERGENLPGVDVVKRLAEATGESFIWIMAGEAAQAEVTEAKDEHESWERLSRADRRRLEKVEDIFRGSEERTKHRLRAVIDLIE